MTFPMNTFAPAMLALVLAAPAAFAKLPTPTPTPEAKAKADETAARAAWAAKVDSLKLCQAQDRVAAKYRTSAAAAGKPVPSPTATPACTDPGPFAYTPPADAKPIEAAGAHSPATTAAAPPNTNQKASEAIPDAKK
jgi:hypothetical protein